MVQYLLPCRCGRKITVDSTKAGRNVECECGAKLEVPTLGGMKKLERVSSEKPAVSRVKWAARQQVFLVGSLVMIVGLAVAGFFALRRPVPPPHQHRIEVVIPAFVEKMSLMESLQVWGSLEQGLPDGLGMEDQRYQAERQAFLHRSGVALFIAGAGVLLMAVSLFIPKKRVRSVSS